MLARRNEERKRAGMKQDNVVAREAVAVLSKVCDSVNDGGRASLTCLLACFSGIDLSCVGLSGEHSTSRHQRLCAAQCADKRPGAVLTHITRGTGHTCGSRDGGCQARPLLRHVR